MLSLVALAALATPVHGEDDFPLVGTYTENQACKTDGSDPGVSRVKITPQDIDSVFGLCTILSKKREGATFVVHVECKGPGGSQMLSDVNFTPREDKTLDFPRARNSSPPRRRSVSSQSPPWLPKLMALHQSL